MILGKIKNINSKLREIILNPNNVTIKKPCNSKSSSAIQLKMNNPNQKLIIVIINKLSGGQSGNDYLNSFYRYLNPLQVINLLDETLSKLKLFSSFPNCSLIVAGGDGTVGSVINYIKEEIPEWGESMPAVAVMPLGTGNDLSRCLGWGG